MFSQVEPQVQPINDEAQINQVTNPAETLDLDLDADPNIDQADVAEIMAQSQLEDEDEDNGDSEGKPTRRIPLAEKLKAEPENPKIFWNAFSKLQKQIQRETKVSESAEENGNGITVNIKEQVLETIRAIAQIHEIENRQNPLVFSKIVRFADSTGLPYPEFVEKVDSYFEAIDKGEFSRKASATKENIGIGKIKAAIPSLTPEQLVELDEAIKAQRTSLLSL